MQYVSGKISPIVSILITCFILAFGLALYFSAPREVLNSELEQPLVSEISEPVVQAEEIIEEIKVDQNTKKADSYYTRIISNNKRSPANANQKKKTAPVNNKNAHQAWQEQAYTHLHVNQNTNNVDGLLPSIAGRVLNPDGKPLRNIKVTAQKRNYYSSEESDSNNASNLVATTNAAGFFAFKDLVDGIYLLSTNTDKRYLPKRIEVQTGVQYADLVLTEMENIMLQGKVIDKNSLQPIMDVHITPLTKGIPGSDTSDELGEFNLDIDIGERTNIPLRLKKDGYKLTRFNVDAYDWEGHQNLVIEMESSSAYGQLTGVVRGDNNNLLHKILVQLYSPSLKMNYKTETNSAGEFYFTDLELAKDYRLWIRPATGYKDFSLERLKVDRDSEHQNIRLESIENAYRIYGQVLDMDNDPITNTTFSLRSRQASHQVIPLTTDEFGAYSVDNVPEGELVIGSNSAPHYTLTGISLSGTNRSAYHDLIIDSGEQKLIGKIVDENNDPISASQIYLTSSHHFRGLHSQASRKTSADSEGKFLFSGLGLEQYTITVNVPGYKGVRIVHRLGSQNVLTVQLKKT